MNKINITILIIFFNTLININYLHSKNSNDLYKKIDLFSEVLETIKNEYVDEVNQAEVMDSAINGVLQLQEILMLLVVKSVDMLELNF